MGGVTFDAEEGGWECGRGSGDMARTAQAILKPPEHSKNHQDIPKPPEHSKTARIFRNRRNIPKPPEHSETAPTWRASSVKVSTLTLDATGWLRVIVRNALGIERTRFIVVLSRVRRAPQNAQSWCLGRPPSTCAHDYVLAFLASAPQKKRKRRSCV